MYLIGLVLYCDFHRQNYEQRPGLIRKSTESVTKLYMGMYTFVYLCIHLHLYTFKSNRQYLHSKHMLLKRRHLDVVMTSKRRDNVKTTSF